MRKNRFTRHTTTEENFWPSFTDLISTIALILFFLLLMIFIENIIVAKDLKSERQKLIKVQDELAMLNAEISEKEKNLQLIEDQADDLKLEVEQGQILLKLSEEQIVKQQKLIANSNKELGNMRTKIQSIAVIRLSILENVRDTLETELRASGFTGTAGEDLVFIGENGNIILNNKLLFDQNSSTIGAEGKRLLSELAVVFEKVLSDDNLRNYIDAVQIEGHTDSTYTTTYNRKLSADRSIAVVDYMLESNPSLEQKYGAYFLASAFSEYRPLVVEHNESDKAKNRRIEISIILKDSNVQNIIDDYMKSINESELGKNQDGTENNGTETNTEQNPSTENNQTTESTTIQNTTDTNSENTSSESSQATTENTSVKINW